MKTVIHVHQNRIRGNLKHGRTDPPIIARTYKEVRYGNRVEIKDKDGNVVARLLYRPAKPLTCGARVWLETAYEVEVSDEVEE